MLLLFFQCGLLAAQRGAFFRQMSDLFFQRVTASFVGIWSQRLIFRKRRVAGGAAQRAGCAWL